MTAHLGSMHSAIKMLISRVALLHQMLLKMQSGEDVWLCRRGIFASFVATTQVGAARP